MFRKTGAALFVICFSGPFFTDCTAKVHISVPDDAGHEI